jgi:hypothetical protein
MKRLRGHESPEARLITTYLNDIPGWTERMKKSLKRQEVGMVKEIAQKIKGESATPGGEQVRDAALVIENDSRAGYPKEISAKIDEPEAEFERFKAEQCSS